MNLKKTLPFYFLLNLVISTSLFAQEKELFIKYEVIDKSEQFDVSMELNQIGSKSLCTIFKTRSMGRRTVVGASMGAGGNNMEIKKKTSTMTVKDHFIYKDITTNEMICRDKKMKYTIIREEMNLFEWQLTSVTDSILGYNCQQAKTRFRGRNYTVWFCVDLGFRAAPWKFYGLPGVILKVESDDEYFSIKANYLKIANAESVIENPYKNKKVVSWDDFTTFYKKSILNAEKQQKASSARKNRPYNPAIVLNPRVEIIIERFNSVTMKEKYQQY